jgi:hypothetical protein
MSNLRTILEQRVMQWERLGHHSLLERFILRNGKDYIPAKRIGRKQKSKECFGNAARHAMTDNATYVEGFTVIPEFEWPVHHAWVSIHGDDAVDPTLDAKGREYIGVAFDRKMLASQLIKNGVYGLLDPGLGLNADLMFEIDPGLKDIVDKIRPIRTRDLCS